MDDVTHLKQCIIFQELTDDELARTAQLMSPEAESFLPGAVICEAGAPGDSLFMVKSGKVQIYLRDDIENIVLAELGPGKFFGEMSLLDKSPRSANVCSLEQTELFVMTRKHVAYMLDKEPKIAAKMMLALARVLSARIRVLNERIQSMLSSDESDAG
jgi:CRP-like cAMP-binding protein